MSAASRSPPARSSRAADLDRADVREDDAILHLVELRREELRLQLRRRDDGFERQRRLALVVFTELVDLNDRVRVERGAAIAIVARDDHEHARRLRRDEARVDADRWLVAIVAELGEHDAGERKDAGQRDVGEVSREEVVELVVRQRGGAELVGESGGERRRRLGAAPGPARRARRSRAIAERSRATVPTGSLMSPRSGMIARSNVPSRTSISPVSGRTVTPRGAARAASCARAGSGSKTVTLRAPRSSSRSAIGLSALPITTACARSTSGSA